MLGARRALAVGDTRRAAEFVRQAKNQNLQYGPMDDTPEKVEAAIQKTQDLASLEKNTEVYRRTYARNLMEQAEALLLYGELDEAERLANVAATQQVSYNLIEMKPQDLLSRIAVIRSGQTPLVRGAQSQPGSLQRQDASLDLVRQSREALAAGLLDRAEELARKAQQARRSDSASASGEDRPELVLSDIGKVRERESSAVVPAANYEAANTLGGDAKHTASAAVYDPANDPTRNVTAAAGQSGSRSAPRYNLAQNGASAMPSPPTISPEAIPAQGAVNREAPSGSALSLFQQGEAALRAHDRDRAYQLFLQAAARKNELDPAVAQRLQDHLQLLSSPAQHSAAQSGGQLPSLLDETAARQQVLARQVAADLAHLEANARAMRESDPKGALSLLEEGRKKVEQAGLEPGARDQLLRRADRAIGEIKQYVDENQPRLDLAEKNNHTRQDIEREARVKQETKEKIAQKIDEFNRLRDEQRYEEAQIAAKQAAELDPNNPVTQQLLTDAKFLYRVTSNNALRDKKEEGFWTALNRVDESSIPFDDQHPYVMPDAKTWGDLTKNRAKLAQAEHRRNLTEREIEIQKKLKTPVSLDFTNAPLSKVVDYLSKIAEINLYLDPKGLAEEGVTTDTPVTIEVRHEIMLKSALNLILQPLHLSYVIKDEVLKITSEQLRDNQVYPVTYNVADLVVPIPNFVPMPMGLSAAYNNAMGAIGFGGNNNTPFGSSGTPLGVVASRDGKNGSGIINPSVLSQITSPHPAGGPHNQPQQPLGFGPGGLGGGTQADFDSLINLITGTVKPSTWDSVGGPGSIEPFETNLSIVVSQTQDVHEEIVDLLEQLRRMQDLQVTIEVRFITLTDNFFERIGVNFDFNIHDNAKNQTAGFGSVVVAGNPAGAPPQEPVFDTLDSDRGTSAVVGTTGPGNTASVYTADLDIPFTQNSFGLSVPQFGGFDATAGAQVGFAILSDIEAYFFINAAQGDRRTNVLQAPKVTLFNGQQASVFDQTQNPFVISVIPVVGDFAAAQQPVIVVLSEGTFMSVQAVISNDRRFVRLTIVPFFSHIGTVNTFTFSGSTSTTTDTTREGIQTTPNDATKNNNNSTRTTSGVTVQLPSFSFVSVTTTVSVPDGGTVLLGGIKRLSEGRNEFGVPILNKIPYLDRLFKNVGVGRETQSLMMMVTPRIIIQEEEEEKLGVTAP